nr:hypothetical protein 1634Bnrm3_p067 [Cryptomonas sp.]
MKLEKYEVIPKHKKSSQFFFLVTFFDILSRPFDFFKIIEITNEIKAILNQYEIRFMFYVLNFYKKYIFLVNRYKNTNNSERKSRNFKKKNIFTSKLNTSEKLIYFRKSVIRKKIYFKNEDLIFSRHKIFS